MKTGLNTDRPSEPRGQQNNRKIKSSGENQHSASHLKYSDLQKVKFGFLELGSPFLSVRVTPALTAEI